MNKQQIFDTVLNHMREQKLPSQNKYGFAYYDEATNRRCVIGCLIPVVKYRPIFDTADKGTCIRVNTPVQQELESQGIEINEEMLDFLNLLQMIHDGMIGEWGDLEERDMKKVAEKHSLKYVP